MFRQTLLCTFLIVAAAPAEEWNQWRGPRRDGVATDTGLLKQWPKEGPPLVWETKGAGRGYASVAVANGRVYTLGDAPSTAKDQNEYVACFDEATGKQVWLAKTGDAWSTGRSADWHGARSTPTVEGDLLYVMTPQGNLVCLETATGKERWRKNMEKDFGGEKGDGWGYSESPLVDGDHVVCTPGGETTLAALDKKTGTTAWKAIDPKHPGAGHSSIVIAEVGGTRVYVQATAGGPLGVRAKDGKVLWTFPIERTTAVIPTPIVRDDLVFFVAGYGRGGCLLRQVPSDDGIAIKTVYPLNPQLANKHGGVVLVGDYLYGDSEDSGSLWCADFKTGKILWKNSGGRRNSAAVVAAEGNLYIQYANGTVTLAQASADKYHELGSFKVPHKGDRPSWAHPVVSNGKLYVREGDHVFCYNLRAQ